LLKEANVIAKELGKDVLYDFVILDSEFDRSTASFWETGSHQPQPSNPPLNSGHLVETSNVGVSSTLASSRVNNGGGGSGASISGPYLGVKVYDGRHDSIYYWTLPSFLARLPMMRTLYSIPESASTFYAQRRVLAGTVEGGFYEGDDEDDGEKTTPNGGITESDAARMIHGQANHSGNVNGGGGISAGNKRRPFFTLIGVASVGVRGLASGVACEVRCPVCDYETGETRGWLRVIVSPISSEVVVLPIGRSSDDEDDAGEDSYIDDDQSEERIDRGRAAGRKASGKRRDIMDRRSSSRCQQRAYLHDGGVVVFEVSILELIGLDENEYTQVHCQFRLSEFGVQTTSLLNIQAGASSVLDHGESSSLIGADHRETAYSVKSGVLGSPNDNSGSTSNSIFGASLRKQNAIAGDRIFSTDPAHNFGSNPIRWEFSQTISLRVTPQVRNAFERGLVRFEVFGKRMKTVKSIIEELYNRPNIQPGLLRVPSEPLLGAIKGRFTRSNSSVQATEKMIPSSLASPAVIGGNSAEKGKVSSHVVLAQVQLLELSNATGTFNFVPVQSIIGSSAPLQSTPSSAPSANPSTAPSPASSAPGSPRINTVKPIIPTDASAPDTFLIRQGIQRRLSVKLCHQSGKSGLPWRRLTYLRVGQIRLINARTNQPVIDEADDKGTTMASNQFIDLQLPGSSIEEGTGTSASSTLMKLGAPGSSDPSDMNRPWFSGNGKSVLEVQVPWDSSLHGSVHLNRVTRRGYRVEMAITWGVEVDPLGAIGGEADMAKTRGGLEKDHAAHASNESLNSISSVAGAGPSNWLVFGGPLHFETRVGLIVHDRDFKVKASTKLMEFIGMGFSNVKYMQKLCAIYETSILRSTNGLLPNDGKPDSSRRRNWAALLSLHAYVRGEECLGGWTPCGQNAVAKYVKSREKRALMDELELTKQRIDEIYLGGSSPVLQR
jgi:kinesin family protein 1